MHYGRIGGDRSTHDIVGVCKVDDDDLVLFINLLSHTNEVVGLEGQCLARGMECECPDSEAATRVATDLEGDGCRLHAQAGELEVLRECDWL